MTMQVQKHKKKQQKSKVVDASKIFEWARAELQKAEELFHKRKKDVILETAKRLEQEAKIPANQISTEITKGLKGFVDATYVPLVLKDYPQYKDEHQSKNAKKPKSGSNIRAKHEENTEGSPKEEQEESQPEVENQTGDDNAPTGYYEIPLEDFRIKDIQLYDRDFLIQLVDFLFKKLPKEEQEKYK